MNPVICSKRWNPPPIAWLLFGLCCLTTLLLSGLSFATDHLYVDADATGTNNGSSWDNAYTSLAVVLNAVSVDSSCEIWVAQGAYKPTGG